MNPLSPASSTTSPARDLRGHWSGTEPPLDIQDPSGVRAIRDLASDLFVVRHEQGLGVSPSGSAVIGDDPGNGTHPLHAWVPALTPAQLGDPSFLRDHGVEYAYVGGAMANGIASVDLVASLAEAGMLGFFGAAGLSPERVHEAIGKLRQRIGDRPHGFNLIHSPNEPKLEDEVARLYLSEGVRCVEASAYLRLTPAIVHYRVKGIHRDASGEVVIPNRVMAKVSRVEVATRFLSPPPDKFLDELLTQGDITPEERELARHIPMCDDLTAEADSGGHTDNRPALALVPTLIALRDRMVQEHGYDRSIRVGAAGGVATPASAAAAFALGAGYVVVGTVHQACRESGSSDKVRELLAAAGQADVAMAPAADMFEMGVKVQVLKRGTLFAMRAGKLYQYYKDHAAWTDIPEKDRKQIEGTFFKDSFETVWARCEEFFQRRDPSQLERAARDPRHKMALVFRWYLGSSSGWANRGEEDRVVDYQVWCGPAIGAFNEWAQGSELASVENRTVVRVARSLLHGAALALRLQSLRQQGIELPADAASLAPASAGDLSAAFGTRGTES